MTFVSAYYDGERNICATYQDTDGQWHDVWFMHEGRTPPPADVLALAAQDEESYASIE